MVNKEKMQELKNDIYALQTICEVYSMYEKKMISEVFAKLMSIYEGIEYTHKFLYDDNKNEKCILMEKDNNHYSVKFYIPIIKPLHNLIDYKYDNDDYYFLPPSYYLDNNNFKIKYLQDFIDFVFEKRINNNKKNIEKETLYSYLEEFIDKNKLQRFLNQNERIHNNEIRIKNEKEKEFKKNSKVSRRPFFKAIESILNDYEESNIKAVIRGQEYMFYNKETEMITFQYYESLKVNRIIKDYMYETLVTEDTVPFDEQELKILDTKTDTYINYFDVKKVLETIQWDCTNLKKFFNKIEEKLKKKSILDEEDINDSYLKVVNDCKKLIR